MKITLSLPATGIKLVTLIKYALVNHDTEAKASRSVAMEPWMVVMRETLQVKMKMSAHMEKQTRMARTVERGFGAFESEPLSTSRSVEVDEVERKSGEVSEDASSVIAMSNCAGVHMGRKVQWTYIIYIISKKDGVFVMTNGRRELKRVSETQNARAIHKITCIIIKCWLCGIENVIACYSACCIARSMSSSVD